MLTQTMTLDRQSGLLTPVTYRPSPHCDARPAGEVVDMIVIHGISLPPGEFGSPAIEAFFCGQLDHRLHPYYASIASLRVSSHLLIKRTGEIIQFVPFAERAWHAGESFFHDRPRCNDFSIGIELEGTDDIAYEPLQYEQLSRVIRLLMQAYPAITKERIVGHVDIAPGRKTDPGPLFDWDYIRKIIV
ncbi:MAG: 1,6-anhydro-N-acetylmuramyl-L-alanine amidase AmpD [Gammaproteobacteria bacterium]|nr:MAG: 1,6-anhydro-N-acetylmuramyl-L-alanine amidase AmpD [Gammaproteobacteria bacterium]